MASDEIADIHHSAGHPGVRRTLYIVKRVYPATTRRQVRDVVANCDACLSNDPAPVKWQSGSLEVDSVWQRVAMDITHYKGLPYLTLIDCGPSRFAVWSQLRLQTSASVIRNLEAVFYERGAPEEILTDNDTAFRSRVFADFMARWCVRLRFRCSHAPSGNGIVERCHRTIKVIAARKGCEIAEAVYLYNLTSRDDSTQANAPANTLYRYPVRIRGVDHCTEDEEEMNNPYKVGDEVWVTPPNARCDSRHSRALVAKVVSDQAVEINGVPRHIKHIRRCASPAPADGVLATDDEELLIQLPAGLVEEESDSGDAAEANLTLPRRSSSLRTQRVCDLCV